MTEPIYVVGIDQALQLTLRKLAAIDKKLDRLLAQGERVKMELDELTAQVAENTEVEASAIALITGLAQQITALKTDPVALQALADRLNGSADALAAAVAANTPASPSS